MSTAAKYFRWQTLCATVNALSDDEVGKRSAELAADVADLPALVRFAPLPWAKRLLEHGGEPRLRFCGAVSLDWSTLDQLWRALDDLPDLENVEALFLSGPGLDPVAARELALSVARLPVERLMVSCPDLGAGLVALFGIPRLRALGASDCGLDGVLDTVAAEAESRLLELDIGTNFLRHTDLEHLVRIRGLERLERFRLTSNKILDVGAEVLAARLPCELRTLDLEGCQIDNAGLVALAGSSRFSKLEQLDLQACHFGDAGVIALAASTGFSALVELDLASNVMTAAGARVLLASTNFPALASLDLSGNEIGDDIVEVVRSSGVKPLASLVLDDSFMSDEARDALVQLGLPALKLLDTR